MAGNVVKVETGKMMTYVERETMAMMHRQFYHFDDAFYEDSSMARDTCLGHPTSGGTVANLEALWAARNTMFDGCDKHGLKKADANGEGVVVVSELGHYSISKAIDILGLGTLSVVTIPTKDFMVDVAALKDKLEELKAAQRKVRPSPQPIRPHRPQPIGPHSETP